MFQAPQDRPLGGELHRAAPPVDQAAAEAESHAAKRFDEHCCGQGDIMAISLERGGNGAGIGIPKEATKVAANPYSVRKFFDHQRGQTPGHLRDDKIKIGKDGATVPGYEDQLPDTHTAAVNALREKMGVVKTSTKHAGFGLDGGQFVQRTNVSPMAPA